MESRYESVYTYPQRVSNQLQKADVGSGAGDPISDEFNTYFTLVKDYCFSMSKIIESETQKTFVPYFDSKNFYFSDIIRDHEFLLRSPAYVLKLDEDLLAVSSITFMEESLTSSQYRLIDIQGSSSGYPYREIHFNTSGLPGWDTNFSSKIQVVGEWGSHDNENNTYSSSTPTTASLDISQSDVKVAEGDSTTYFSIYQYIRIEDELMLITDITLSEGNPDTLTVIRGAQGSTKATHESGSDITIWNVVSDIELLATRMVAYWYNKRSDKGERVQVIDDALVIAQFSKEIHAIAKRRRQNLVGII